MTLSHEQLQSLKQGNAIPVREAGIECVLVRADIYERVQGASAGDEWTADELRSLAQRTFADADSADAIP
jgi:hypothetical protein